MNYNAFKSTPALILAGGLGTRLRSVEANLPKPMVHVSGKPFLFWLVKHLTAHGFKEFIFSLGYKAESIANYPWKDLFPQNNFEFLKEENPLGTGGAVKAVFEEYALLERAWIVNGDTLLQNPIEPERNISDDVLYTALSPREVFDAKPNLVTQGDLVISISDDQGKAFDGGQVLISRQAALSYTGKIPCSFHQLIEGSMKAHKVRYEVVAGTCFDIGTPERLKRFESYIKNSLT